MIYPTDTELDEWYEASKRDNTIIVGSQIRVLVGEVRELREKTTKLQAFKAYTHERLDQMGVPVDPESPHKAEGCRIGGRLDWVESRIGKIESAYKELYAFAVWMTGSGDFAPGGCAHAAFETQRHVLDRFAEVVSRT